MGYSSDNFRTSLYGLQEGSYEMLLNIVIVPFGKLSMWGLIPYPTTYKANFQAESRCDVTILKC